MTIQARTIQPIVGQEAVAEVLRQGQDVRCLQTEGIHVITHLVPLRRARIEKSPCRGRHGCGTTDTLSTGQQLAARLVVGQPAPAQLLVGDGQNRSRRQLPITLRQKAPADTASDMMSRITPQPGSHVAMTARLSRVKVASKMM